MDERILRQNNPLSSSSILFGAIDRRALRNQSPYRVNSATCNEFSQDRRIRYCESAGTCNRGRPFSPCSRFRWSVLPQRESLSSSPSYGPHARKTLIALQRSGQCPETAGRVQSGSTRGQRHAWKMNRTLFFGDSWLRITGCPRMSHTGKRR